MRLLIPLTLLLCLLGATWMVVQNPEVVRTHPYQGLDAPRLLEFEADEVRNLRIERGSQVCIIRHQDGYWQLTSPIRDRVHQALPAMLIALAENAQALESFTLEEMRERGQSLEDYGLGKQAVRLRYADANNDSLFHLEVGKLCPWHFQVDPEKPTEPTLYLRLPNSPASQRIFIIPAVVRGQLNIANISQAIEESNLPELLSEPFEQYRSAQLLPLSALHATQLRWQSENFTTEAQRQESDWEIISPIATPARDAQIQILLQNLTGAPAYQLVAQGALPFPEEFTTLNVTAPDLDGTERDFQLDIATTQLQSPASPNPTQDQEEQQDQEGQQTQTAQESSNSIQEQLIFVRPSHRKLLFTFQAKHQPWLSPTLKDLRSRQLLNLDGWAIKEVLLNSPKNPQQPALMLAIDQGQATVSWLPSMLATFANTRPADSENLEELVALLHRAQVSDFITDAPADPSNYGLDAPQLVINLKLQKATPQVTDTRSADTEVTSEETNPAPLKRSLQVLIAQGEDGNYYAQRSDGISVFQVAPSILEQIPLDVGFWRSKRVFNFSSSQILEIRRVRKNYENEALRFNPLLDRQELEIKGRDLSELMLSGRAQNLQKSLAQLRASAWLSKTTLQQQKALGNPDLLFEITTGNLELSTNFSNPTNPQGSKDSKRYLLKLSAMANPKIEKPALWLGQLEGEQSAFVLSPETVDILAAELIPSLEIETEGSTPAPPPPPPPYQ